MSHIKNFWQNETETDQKINKDCCGCSACADKCPKNAITMIYDKEGFLYPKVNTKLCINCSLCLKTCPIENGNKKNNPYIKTYAGYTLNEEIINNCTSGGLLTALSLKYIENDDIVAGVRYSKDFIKSEYFIGQSREDIISFSNSKYVQSEKNKIYKHVKEKLDNNKKVLFVGCPCEVSGLILFLNKDYKNLLTCELVCMGVSSYKIAESYKNYKEKKLKSKLLKINARSKRCGWFVPHLEEEYENGKNICKPLYGTYLGYGMQVYNRLSCFFCKYRDTNGVGDIRVGDFWGIKDTDKFWNPNGVSCIFIRNKKGLEALKLLNKTEFKLFETDYIKATRSNMSSYLNKSQKYLNLRNKFSYIYENHGLIKACNVTGSISFWARRLLPENFLITVKKNFHKITDKS